jgi:hypothetical protein
MPHTGKELRPDERRVRRPGISLPPPQQAGYRAWDGAFQDRQPWQGSSPWQVLPGGFSCL